MKPLQFFFFEISKFLWYTKHKWTLWCMCNICPDQKFSHCSVFTMDKHWSCDHDFFRFWFRMETIWLWSYYIKFKFKHLLTFLIFSLCNIFSALLKEFFQSNKYSIRLTCCWFLWQQIIFLCIHIFIEIGIPHSWLVLPLWISLWWWIWFSWETFKGDIFRRTTCSKIFFSSSVYTLKIWYLSKSTYTIL